ncbi:5'-methylthioadenosine/S-adenosylhomocysteine nucleosidase family protein [Pseudomonas aeruginosa]|uniref:5'-methylthioadenosine/S-adenosylhomocysteine nucleosidase family protein n=1 Tax=Pseudomonas aeruginosa TaxID=287 RepID=UPI0026EDD7D1|nr:hypothetical protein [Pseudomonas aeruginosa]
MNILIADDSKTRYRNLLARLGELGVEKNQIKLVGSADEAHTALREEKYDLLVLDILLPLYSTDDDVSHEHSLQILYDINHDPEVIKPSKVIGITADIHAAGVASERFAECTWSIIPYSQTDDEWIQRIVNCVQYIMQESVARPCICGETQSVDVAVLCALESPEFEEIMKLSWNWSPARPIHDYLFVKDGWFESKGTKITVSAAYSTRMGMVESALKSFIIISKLKPKIITMTGICAGVSSKVKLGDVLFADPAWDFQNGKHVKEKGKYKFNISPHHLPAAYKARVLFEQLRSDKEFLQSLPRMFADNCKYSTDLKLGPVASGSAVLADGRTIESIKEQQRELVGVEMEIYGLYAAGHTSSPAPRYFALKGVCDFADPDKDDEAQRYAAYASARVLQKLLENNGAQLIGDS